MNLDRMIAVRNDKTVYRDGNLCVKIFGGSYSRADIFHEAENMARAEEAGICVPKLQGVTRLDGKWAILSEYIRGETLAQQMKRMPEQKTKAMEQMVTLQYSVQEKRSLKLCQMKDRMKEMMKASSISVQQRSALCQKLEQMPCEEAFCHGDINPHNILIAQTGEIYLLDWSHAVQGNAAADAAKSYAWLLLHENKESAEQYLSVFCRKSKLTSEQILHWMPLVAAAQLSNSKEAERIFFSSWLNEISDESKGGC